MIGILSSVFGRSCHVHQQVPWHPTHSQHKKDPPSLSQWSFSQHIFGPVTASGRSKHFIILATSSVGMMLLVCDSPGVEWHQEQRMANCPHSIISKFTLRERLVSTFMSNDPHTSENRPLRIPLEGPQQIGGPLRKRRMSYPSTKISNDCNQGQISQQMGH